MKIIYSLFTFLGATLVWGQVGVGTTNPHPTAILEVSSTDKGFLPPRMTKTEIGNINNPEKGLIVYCTTNDCNPIGLYHYNGIEWAPVSPPFSLVQVEPSPPLPNGFTGVFASGENLNVLGTFNSDQAFRATFRIRLTAPFGIDASFTPKSADIDLSGTGLSVLDIDYQRQADGSRQENASIVSITGGSYTDLFYELQGTPVAGLDKKVSLNINDGTVQVSFEATLNIPAAAAIFSYNDKRLYHTCSLNPTAASAVNYENYISNGTSNVVSSVNNNSGVINAGTAGAGATAYIAAKPKVTTGTGDYKIARQVTSGGTRDFNYTFGAGDYTLTIGQNITQLQAVAIGGGGGGGANSNTSNNTSADQGAGGGGGGFIGGTFNVTPNTNLSIRVATGTGAASNQANGDYGGDSYVDYFSNRITALGGGGGGGGWSESGDPQLGGAAGGRTNTELNTTLLGAAGRNGDAGQGFPNAGNGNGGVGGGAADFGLFGDVTIPNIGIMVNNGDGDDGNPGNLYGGGGSGAEDAVFMGNKNGGAGARGAVAVKYICPIGN